jgi:hypothetical protein
MLEKGNREQGGLSPIDNKKTLSYPALGRSGYTENSP